MRDTIAAEDNKTIGSNGFRIMQFTLSERTLVVQVAVSSFWACRFIHGGAPDYGNIGTARHMLIASAVLELPEVEIRT